MTFYYYCYSLLLLLLLVSYFVLRFLFAFILLLLLFFKFSIFFFYYSFFTSLKIYSSFIRFPVTTISVLRFRDFPVSTLSGILLIGNYGYTVLQFFFLWVTTGTVTTVIQFYSSSVIRFRDFLSGIIGSYRVLSGLIGSYRLLRGLRLRVYSFF